MRWPSTMLAMHTLSIYEMYLHVQKSLFIATHSPPFNPTRALYTSLCEKWTRRKPINGFPYEYVWILLTSICCAECSRSRFVVETVDSIAICVCVTMMMRLLHSHPFSKCWSNRPNGSSAYQNICFVQCKIRRCEGATRKWTRTTKTFTFRVFPENTSGYFQSI